MTRPDGGHPRPQVVTLELRAGDTTSRLTLDLQHPGACTAATVDIREEGDTVRVSCPACRAGATLTTDVTP